MSSKELGLVESAYNGPECPPRFEKFIGVVGLFDWAQAQYESVENIVCENYVEKGNEAEQSFGESHGSFSKSGREGFLDPFIRINIFSTER